MNNTRAQTRKPGATRARLRLFAFLAVAALLAASDLTVRPTFTASAVEYPTWGDVTAARGNEAAAASQIAAIEASVHAQEAALAHADWTLSQKTQSSPVAGLVYDTLYQQGEWVAAGRPAVSLLPPENVKVRAFVPEDRVSGLKYGQPVRVFVDGIGEPYAGKVSFISPRAEYTPPVIYSRESRGKLVFMVESVFDAETAAKLHPGQPLDVEFEEQ